MLQSESKKLSAAHITICLASASEGCVTMFFAALATIFSYIPIGSPRSLNWLGIFYLLKNNFNSIVLRSCRYCTAHIVRENRESKTTTVKSVTEKPE